jgi:hypothetical protein
VWGKFELNCGLLKLIPAVLLILLSAEKARALEPVFKYINSDSSSIQTGLVISDSLPAELIGYINKGVPILFDYRLELWRARSGWFDKLAGASEAIFKVRYDPWDKKYSVVENRGDLIIENTLHSEREAIELLSSSGIDTLVADDPQGVFYLVGRLTIKTMSFSNYKEVESWLKGGISNAGKPEIEEAPSKIGEFVFNLAMRVSGLRDISREIRSPDFKLGEQPLLH